MVVKIRLARFGRAHQAFYNIVVSNARTARNSKPLEVLGTYNPYPRPPLNGEGPPQKSIQLDITRAKYWLGVGAQPTESAWDLLEKAGLLPMRLHKQKSIWRSKTMDDMYRSIKNGEMTVEEMLDKVGTLDEEFARELCDRSEQQKADLKTRNEESLELDIDDFLPEPEIPANKTPVTGRWQSMRKTVQKTRSMLHSKKPEDLPLRWSANPESLING